ncbi:MAG: histidinol dehydrogenase [Synergistaceae bacterium]|nr:histidinol dehydrogenase [Synergistaceae bacterium]
MEYIKASLERPAAAAEELRRSVADIIGDVRENGDEALLRYNRKFDLCSRERLRVTDGEIERAWREVPSGDADDIRRAAENIRRFAEAQRETVRELPSFVPSPGAGITLGHRIIPVRSCCCYVPGGGYPLYSTALMLAIPAAVAGVDRIAACSPVRRGTDSIHPKTLVAMNIAGVHEIYAIGGAQAIAAFSWGTGQIEPVDLVVGPGNSYVTEAKRQCYGQVGIDFVAGPSEVMVIVDAAADADLIAADLLAQCEHDRTAKGIVVTTDRALGERVAAVVERLLDGLETAEIARRSWEDYGEIILVDSPDEAVVLADKYAPEHLEIQTEDAEEFAKKFSSYGSLFIGKYTAEVFGDYASGTNHTLPTLRAARYTGGVWVGTFLKTCTHQTFTREAMLGLAPLVSRLARGEGLIAHAGAAEIRREKYDA